MTLGPSQYNYFFQPNTVPIGSQFDNFFATNELSNSDYNVFFCCVNQYFQRYLTELQYGIDGQLGVCDVDNVYDYGWKELYVYAYMIMTYILPFINIASYNTALENYIISTGATITDTTNWNQFLYNYFDAMVDADGNAIPFPLGNVGFRAVLGRYITLCGCDSCGINDTLPASAIVYTSTSPSAQSGQGSSFGQTGNSNGGRITTPGLINGLNLAGQLSSSISSPPNPNATSSFGATKPDNNK